LEDKLRVAVLGLVFSALLSLVHFESRVFMPLADWVVHARAVMVVLIFTHNSLAATAIVVGMLFASTFVEALPVKYRRGNGVAVARPKVFSAVFAVLLVLRSLLVWGGSLNANALLHCVPVAALEACGLYLATLMGLRSSVSMKNMATLYALFLAGAIMETLIITS
jgi:hypothetical protein